MFFVQNALQSPHSTAVKVSFWSAQSPFKYANMLKGKKGPPAHMPDIAEGKERDALHELEQMQRYHAFLGARRLPQLQHLIYDAMTDGLYTEVARLDRWIGLPRGEGGR